MAITTSIRLDNETHKRWKDSGETLAALIRRGLDHAEDTSREDKLERLADFTGRLVDALTEQGYTLTPPASAAGAVSPLQAR